MASKAILKEIFSIMFSLEALVAKEQTCINISIALGNSRFLISNSVRIHL